MAEQISHRKITALRTWYQHRVPAKEAAAELEISHQCVYAYYKIFKAEHLEFIPLNSLPETPSA